MCDLQSLFGTLASNLCATFVYKFEIRQFTKSGHADTVGVSFASILQSQHLTGKNHGINRAVQHGPVAVSVCVVVAMNKCDFHFREISAEWLLHFTERLVIDFDITQKDEPGWLGLRMQQRLAEN